MGLTIRNILHIILMLRYERAVTQEAKTYFGDHLIRRWGCGDDESGERSQRRTSDITSSKHHRNLYLHRRSWRHVLRVLLQHERHIYCYAGVHCQRLPRCGWPWQASRWVTLSLLWLIFVTQCNVHSQCWLDCTFLYGVFLVLSCTFSCVMLNPLLHSINTTNDLYPILLFAVDFCISTMHVFSF